MPLLFVAIGLFPQIQQVVQETPFSSVETIFTSSETLTTPTGYVDQAGVILSVPADLAENLTAFEDEAAARQALQAGEIDGLYIITAGYAESREIIHISADPQLFSQTDTPIRGLLRDNLLQTLDDPHLAARLESPVNLERDGRAPPPVFSFIPADLERERLISAGLVVGLFAMVINVGGYLIVRALHRETRVRVLEVLITSATAEQFIGGKLLGLTILSLSQATTTMLAGALVYGRTSAASGSAAVSVPALALSLPFLLFGFVAYCGGIMTIAAIWPNLPESGPLLAIARMLALSPVIGAIFILPNPHSQVSVFLTLFPPTASLLMPFRLLLTSVPPWQLLAGLVGQMILATLILWLSMRFFRLSTLLTGRAPSSKVLWQAIRG